MVPFKVVTAWYSVSQMIIMILERKEKVVQINIENNQTLAYITIYK